MVYTYSYKYYLQSLHVQLSPFHFFILFIKIESVGESFILFGRVFQIKLPLKTNEFVPKVVDTAFGRFNRISLLKL